MIELQVKEHCHDCPCFDVVANKIYGDNKAIATIITCENMELCNRLLNLKGKEENRK